LRKCPESGKRVRRQRDDLVVDQLIAALIGVVVGAFGSHLLTQQRERGAEQRRARNICRILHRDLFQVYLAVQGAMFGNVGNKIRDPWPPASADPIPIRLDNWNRLGADFTMVCRDEALWEAVCIGFEEAEVLASGQKLNSYRLDKAKDRIMEAVERTGDVNRAWSAKMKRRWKARRAGSDPGDADDD
jgi:hypothetical protein